MEEERFGIISIRGQPLPETPPIKSKLPVRTNRNDAKKEGPKMHNKLNNNKEKSLNETKENTRQNGHRTVRIHVMQVKKETPRPPSPSAHLRQKNKKGEKKAIRLEEEDYGRRVRFQPFPSPHKSISSQPPYYDTTFPLKGCLRRGADEKRTKREEPDMVVPEFVVVQKFVYAENSTKSKKSK